MKCPNAEKGFCPAKREMNEHHNEQWSEYYCETCGYEGKEVLDVPRVIKRDPLPPPSPPRRKKTTTPQQY
jgi:hypothetical protein